MNDRCRPSAAQATPLHDVKVLDLSSLVPGPLASLLLAEAGADVIKIERPGSGDEMRRFAPRVGDVGATYALLNRGKRVFGADLKNPLDRGVVRELARSADVIIEQFRPGVADRLGVGYADIAHLNPRVIYCSITGYGQSGPRAAHPGHDLTYLAEAGLLSLSTSADGTPAMPFTVIADIAGGAYPAVINILLALRAREQTGCGTYLDVSMAGNLAPLTYRYWAGWHAGIAQHGDPVSPVPNGEQLTGGTARYRLYRTADDRFIAVAALEDHFWHRVVELAELPPACIDDRADQSKAIAAAQERFASRAAHEWASIFEGEDACFAVVASFDEAIAAGVLAGRPRDSAIAGGVELPALPLPLTPPVRETARALLIDDLRDVSDASDHWR